MCPQMSIIMHRQRQRRKRQRTDDNNENKNDDHIIDDGEEDKCEKRGCKKVGKGSGVHKKKFRPSVAQPRPKVTIPPKGIGPITRSEFNDNDVLCGRGGKINSHKGNVKFRSLIKSKKEEYLAPTTKKLQKAFIALSIVQEMRSMDPPGRFLREEESERGVWYDIGDAKAIKKAGQALREDAQELRLMEDGEEYQIGDVSYHSTGEDEVVKKKKVRIESVGSSLEPPPITPQTLSGSMEFKTPTEAYKSEANAVASANRVTPHTSPPGPPAYHHYQQPYSQQHKEDVQPDYSYSYYRSAGPGNSREERQPSVYHNYHFGSRAPPPTPPYLHQQYSYDHHPPETPYSYNETLPYLPYRYGHQHHPPPPESHSNLDYHSFHYESAEALRDDFIPPNREGTSTIKHERPMMTKEEADEEWKHALELFGKRFTPVSETHPIEPIDISDGKLHVEENDKAEATSSDGSGGKQNTREEGSVEEQNTREETKEE